MTNIKEVPLGNPVTIVGQVIKRIETGGPTIFLVNDGAQVVPAKLFKGKADVQQGDFVAVEGTVSSYNGEKEVSITSIAKSDNAQAAMQSRIDKLAEPPRTKLSADAEYLRLLHPIIKKAAQEIRKAVLSARPIYVRHHCDVDGFTGGLQIEKAIEEIATDPKYILRRSVMRAPFYEMEDIIRDISLAEADKEKWGAAMPLVIVLDNGSSTQDVDAIFLGKQHGFDFIVCDHHVFGERDAITELTLAHINQLRFGHFETCTGILSFELARMISPHFAEFHDIPAVSGISDRVKDEVQTFHESKSKAPKELLVQFEQVLTWLLGVTPPCDNTDFLQELFWSSPEYKKAIVKQYLPTLQDQCKSALEVLELTKDVRKVGDVDVAFLPVSLLPRRTYPKVGMATGLFFDKAKQINPKSMTVGVMDDGLVLRIMPDTNTDVHKVIAYLDSKLPYPVLGGGHAVAGSAKLSKVVTDPKELEEIKQLILQHVKEVNGA